MMVETTYKNRVTRLLTGLVIAVGLTGSLALLGAGAPSISVPKESEDKPPADASA